MNKVRQPRLRLLVDITGGVVQGMYHEGRQAVDVVFVTSDPEDLGDGKAQREVQVATGNWESHWIYTSDHSEPTDRKSMDAAWVAEAEYRRRRSQPPLTEQQVRAQLTQNNPELASLVRRYQQWAGVTAEEKKALNTYLQLAYERAKEHGQVKTAAFPDFFLGLVAGTAMSRLSAAAVLTRWLAIAEVGMLAEYLYQLQQALEA